MARARGGDQAASSPTPSRSSLPERWSPLLPNYRKPELEILALYANRQHLTTKVRVFL
jgi:hypothetical protein